MKTRQPENRSGGSHSQPIVVLDAVFSGDKSSAAQRALRLLAAPEFCVHSVTEQSQTIPTAAMCQPDLVLLNSNATDLCRQLKAGPGKVPIVVLLIKSPRAAKARTEPSSSIAPEASAQPDSASTAATPPQCGADLCLPKNLDPALLIDILRSLLRMGRAERELDRSSKELVDFSRQIAHDIEGPLRGVVTFAELIGQEHPLTPKERTYLGHVLSSADQVRRLARCFLSYAEARRELPGLAAIPLRGVVVAAVHTLRDRIKESAADVHIPERLPSVLGDFSALQQVIHNLLTNAINYRRRDASLSVMIDAKPGPSGDWLISVADNGVGVGKQYQESIFAPFKRLHGLDIPGAGMGLAICRQIVEAHGGRIWVESDSERGASFFFTLRAPG
jgi:signal transduction histidine kinase